MCDVLYFGNDCLTSIIISDILQQKRKLLFSLGVFPFNNILQFLKEKHWWTITDKQYLKPMNNHNKDGIQFKNEESSFAHISFGEMHKMIVHTKYNFIFNHDYIYSEEDNTILNYEFIERIYNEKINNNWILFTNDNPLIFISFMDNTNDIVNTLDEMIEVLNSYINKKYYLFIFTKENTIQTTHENVIFIILKNDYRDWYKVDLSTKNIIYKEIYDSFYNTTQALQLNHHFPTFEESNYYKASL